MFTMFMDMHSGGQLKIPPYQFIIIEADETDAKDIFESELNFDPCSIGCPCCGDNFSASTEETLAEVTGYQRGCDCQYFCDDGRVLTEPELREMTKTDREAKLHNPGRWKWVEKPRKPNGKVQPVEEFLARKDVLVVKPTHPWARKDRSNCYEDEEED